MNIQISPLAEQRLTQILGDQPGYIKLFYDTEGCGCDGITVLKSVSAPDNGDIEVQAGSLPFLVSGQQGIYFEESMRLDADEKFPSYKLSSDSTFYSNNVKTRDVRPS
ncbi:MULTISPECIES: iron-sulfur cluster biosynthesis family protein [unclassified Paenibacillus]|uniref:iron-sulfur cluster biosynthesis family protein n=1 Tax=unclassified Paenibacillus TaxID=185978 RepID=UPI0024BAAC42|nr:MULTISPECIES: iron-sulfur cluster biosynthesis family protein [unclassified Paenibacillus]